MELPTASIREFARIVGVDHSAVVRAVKAGGRLPGSVAYEDGKPRIIISIGCYEWLSNKKHEKDHGTVRRGIMPPDVSSQMDRHYSALLRRMEYEKASGELMPAARQQQEAAEYFRACRDSIWTLPLIVSELSRSVMLGLIRNQGDEFIQSMQGPMDNAVLTIRNAAKGEVRKALTHAAELMSDAHERTEAMEAGEP